MKRPRVQDVVMVALAAVVTSSLTAFAATAPDPDPTSAEATESPSEIVSDPVGDEPTETVIDEEPTENVVDEEPTEVVEDPTEEFEELEPEDADDGDKGNAHGKAVSAAARGETPPVGDCRNHGHWVSTVAKGLASCDDNPRPAKDKAAAANSKTDRSQAAKPEKAAKPAKPATPGKPAGTPGGKPAKPGKP